MLPIDKRTRRDVVKKAFSSEAAILDSLRCLFIELAAVKDEPGHADLRERTVSLCAAVFAGVFAIHVCML